MQSFDPRALAVLERIHSPDDVPRAIECVRRRVDNLSLDLIFGIPGQTARVLHDGAVRFRGWVADGQLSAFRHRGFWQAMDTLRDKMLLDDYLKNGNAPWVKW